MLKIRSKKTKKEKIQDKQLKKAKKITILFDKSCEECKTQDCYHCTILENKFEKEIKKVIK